jgi:hypothetical protein
VSMPSWWILEQSNPGGRMKGLVLAFFFCCFTGFTAGARDGRVLRANGLAAKSASETPVMPTSRAAKMRKLKKAEREVDFFFMNDYEVDGV